AGKGLFQLPALDIPQAHGCIHSYARQRLLIRRKINPAHNVAMAFKCAQDLSRGKIPDANRLVSAGADDAIAVGKKAHAINICAVAAESLLELAGLWVPELDSLIAAAGRELCII